MLESLKKRRSGVYRAVPVPPALLEALDLVHGIRELQARRGKGRGVRLWPWSRMTGWRAVHAVMVSCGLDGPHASPKGLRHGFGVAAVSAGGEGMAVRAISLDPPFRPAVPEDAPALVDFIDYASAGMALIAWAQAVGPGSGDPRAFGLATVRGEASSMSYRNTVVVDDGDGPIAALISHPLPAEPQPIPAGPPGLTNPWQELRNDACGAWHIGVLAAYPAHRGRGLGTALVGIADALRAAHGARRLSLLVADANTRGRHLYERLGFHERARRPMTQGAWTNLGKDWLLLVRDA